MVYHMFSRFWGYHGLSVVMATYDIFVTYFCRKFDGVLIYLKDKIIFIEIKRCQKNHSFSAIL